MLHGREPVRDDERGAAAGERFERLLHQALARRVERARRLVEQQDRPVGEQRARNREPLALSARERHAALAELGVERLRQALDEFERMRLLAGALHFFQARLRTPVADVFRHARGEDHRVLRHHGDQPAQRDRIHAAHVDAVDPHAARLRIVEPEEQREHGRLPGARGADERDPLALRDPQREAL